ncbi:MAG TPA: hypothetical protein VFT24_10260 [Vicinamibacterales bacterium]|nr:hypothetical protein [Vicinamibacterales bacterium]
MVTRLRFLLSAALAGHAIALSGMAADPFDIFRPGVELRPAERQALDRGAPALTLPAADGRQFAVFSAIGIDSEDRGRVTGWMRHIEQLRKNRYVEATGRFSTPIHETDIGAITLDARDLNDIKNCRPGRCNVKLSAAEMQHLQRVIAASGTEWRAAVQRAFQTLVLRRVSTYVKGGHTALDDYADHRVPRSPSDAFRLVAGRTTILDRVAPGILEQAARCPATLLGPRRGFIYWSKVRLGEKTVISATHVVFVEPKEDPSVEMLAIGIQIFATHYLDAALEITAVVRNPDWSTRYLVHIHRSEVDLLDGIWGGLARSAIASRIRKDGPAMLEAARYRLTALAPPGP